MHDTNLLQLITDDFAPAQHLLELLQTESLALHGRDMPLLEEILAQKQALIILLDQHGRKRDNRKACRIEIGEHKKDARDRRRHKYIRNNTQDNLGAVIINEPFAIPCSLKFITKQITRAFLDQIKNWC